MFGIRFLVTLDLIMIWCKFIKIKFISVNFEICNSTDLLNTKLQFLYDNRIAFYNYKILRSYLGLARRDLKHLDKATKNKPSTNRNKNKKLIHAIRGYYTAKQILESLSTGGYGNTHYNNKQPINVFNELMSIKSIESDKDRNIIKKNISE